MVEDEKIIELLFVRSEQAINELDTQYGKTCHKISYNMGFCPRYLAGR